jgi:hypothetical protein
MHPANAFSSSTTDRESERRTGSRRLLCVGADASQHLVSEDGRPMGCRFFDRGASCGLDGAPPNHGEPARAGGAPPVATAPPRLGGGLLASANCDARVNPPQGLYWPSRRNLFRRRHTPRNALWLALAALIAAAAGGALFFR